MNTRSGTSVWADPRAEETLRQLWLTGLTAAAIATRIASQFRCGNLTKSAVVGKVHRLDLPARQNPCPGGRRKPSGNIPEPSQAKPSQPPQPKALPQPLPASGWMRAPKTCCWPFGGRPYTWCDEPALPGRSYCAEHQARAYGPRPPPAQVSA